MRLTAPAAGLFLIAMICLTSKSLVSAEAPQQLLGPQYSLSSVHESSLLKVIKEQAEVVPVEAPQPDKPVEHVIAANETLTTVAKQYETTWRRLYDKNAHITNPDVVTAGQKLVVPKPDEKLVERALPAPEVQIKAVARTASANPNARQSRPASVAAAASPRGASTGNRYIAGYCTWYVKNRRPDLPNNLGDAATWVTRAQAQGIPTGSTPVAGAVGQRGNHVVYVERVNGDNTIVVSEMNHVGYNIVSSRTVPANYFQYIY